MEPPRFGRYGEALVNQPVVQTDLCCTWINGSIREIFLRHKASYDIRDEFERNPLVGHAKFSYDLSKKYTVTDSDKAEKIAARTSGSRKEKKHVYLLALFIPFNDFIDLSDAKQGLQTVKDLRTEIERYSDVSNLLIKDEDDDYEPQDGVTARKAILDERAAKANAAETFFLRVKRDAYIGIAAKIALLAPSFFLLLSVLSLSPLLITLSSLTLIGACIALHTWKFNEDKRLSELAINFFSPPRPYLEVPLRGLSS